MPLRLRGEEYEAQGQLAIERKEFVEQERLHERARKRLWRGMQRGYTGQVNRTGFLKGGARPRPEGIGGFPFFVEGASARSSCQK